MNRIPAELRYVDSHEWVRLESDGMVTVGITDHAQQLLGDVVFVELPNLGKVLNMGDQVGVLESVKAASDVYAPLSGTVVEVNDELEATPELVNSEPYGNGWFFRLKPVDSAELDGLLTAQQYADEIGSE